MKKLLNLSLCVLLALAALAQTQQGVVKTRGRMVNGVLQPGQGLQGATVQVKDRQAVVSGAKGKFSFPLQTNTYLVQSVKKQGYQLVDMETCRNYQYSVDPLYLVMETPEQQRSDLLAAERKIRRNLQRQLEEKEEQIEALQVSQLEKDSLLHILYQQQTDNEKLINNMAKRYATLDYDQLDEFYRQVSWYIENGELTRADSLLRTRGDINAQVQGIILQGHAIEEQEAKLRKAKTVHQEETDEAARRCYSYYETFFAQHQNDSAAHYLGLRAQLDTTNVEWGLEMAIFCQDFLSDYQRALSISKSIYEHTIDSVGDKSPDLLPILNVMGATLYYQGDYQGATNVFQQALSIAQIHLQEGDLAFAELYEQNGYVCYFQSKFKEAIAFFEQALAIYEADEEEHYDEMGMLMNSLGAMTSSLGDYEGAIRWYEKSLQAFMSCYDETNPAIAMANNNIGFNQKALGRSEKALACYEKALFIWKKNYGEKHPFIAACYNNIGGIYDGKEDYQQALFYYQQALDIDLTILGDKHPDTGTCYNNIGYIYSSQREYDKAIDFFQKGLAIRLAAYGNQHSSVAKSYNNIGNAYLQKGNFSESLTCFEKVLAIREQIYDSIHPLMVSTYKYLGMIHSKLGNNDSALLYYEKALQGMKDNNQEADEIRKEMELLK